MQQELLRDSVRELRKRLTGPNGEPLSQTEFGRLIGKTLNTVQRYETLVPPKGAVLIQLTQLALNAGHRDLARIFKQRVSEELGLVELHGVVEIWSIALEAQRQLVANRDGPEESHQDVDCIQVLEAIIQQCVDIQPALQKNHEEKAQHLAQAAPEDDQ